MQVCDAYKNIYISSGLVEKYPYHIKLWFVQFWGCHGPIPLQQDLHQGCGVFLFYFFLLYQITSQISFYLVCQNQFYYLRLFNWWRLRPFEYFGRWVHVILLPLLLSGSMCEGFILALLLEDLGFSLSLVLPHPKQGTSGITARM